MGRLTADPKINYSTNDKGQLAIAKYTLAVDRTYGDGTDFISCVAFGRNGEFAEKYLSKGKKIVVEGRIQTGSYVNSKGEKVYTTDVVVENQEFAESKQTEEPTVEMEIPDNIDDSNLPFNF